VRLIDDLVLYWDRKRAGRVAPRRADIDPSEIVGHLPYIFMLDVIDSGKDFRFRLIGTRIVEGLGRDNTGKLVSEAYGDRPEALAQLLAVFRLPLSRRVPIFARGRIFWIPDARYRRFTGASMPLSDDGLNVNIVLAEMFVEHGGKLY
jgi:hypothetical protein